MDKVPKSFCRRIKLIPIVLCYKFPGCSAPGSSFSGYDWQCFIKKVLLGASTFISSVCSHNLTLQSSRSKAMNSYKTLTSMANGYFQIEGLVRSILRSIVGRDLQTSQLPSFNLFRQEGCACFFVVM